MKQITFYDEFEVAWTRKELEKLLMKVDSEPHEITIYFDGGFNHATNQAGLGVVVYYKQGEKQYRIRVNELISEMETNNEAEYAALFFALDLLEELGVSHIPCHIKGDSHVVLKQLEGEWPCYEESLNKWLDRIEQKIAQLKIKPTYFPLSRKDNKEADKLATQALEGVKVHSKLEL